MISFFVFPPRVGTSVSDGMKLRNGIELADFASASIAAVGPVSVDAVSKSDCGM